MDKNPGFLFHSLSDKARRDVLRLLAEAPLTVGEIVEILRLPQSTVSRHLKNLRATGLLVERREGNRLFTGLTEPAGDGPVELPDLINQWIRGQPLSGPAKTRLRRVLEGRNGQKDAFERLAHQWDELRRQYFGNQFHLEALCALLPGEWRVLDIGTGTGYLLPVLSRSFTRVSAVDPSPAMLGLARQRALRENLENIDFELGRLESLPLRPASVDATLAILVLHHAQNLPLALKELFRVLRPGGSLLVVDLAPHSLEDFQREMGDPIRGLDCSELVTIMKQAGFTDIRQRALPVPSPNSAGAPERLAPEMYLVKALRG